MRLKKSDPRYKDLYYLLYYIIIIYSRIYKKHLTYSIQFYIFGF